MAENLNKDHKSTLDRQFQPSTLTAKILLVDDDTLIQNEVRHLLSREYEVAIVSNVDEVSGTLERERPDLLLLDIGLLKSDEFALLRDLRKASETKDITIILLSTTTEEDIVLEGLEAGADDYLLEPFTARELSVRIRANLKTAKIRQREQELQQEQKAVYDRVHDILESISDAFVAFDRHWQYIYVNQKATELLHKTKEELLGRVLWQVFPEGSDLNLLWYRELQRALREQVAVVFEDFSPTLQTWLEVHAYPIPEGLAVYFQDITERKQAQEERRENENRLRIANERFDLAATAVNCLIYDWDIERNTVERTEGLTRILGYSPEETEPGAEWWFGLCHPDDIEPMRSQSEMAWMKSDRWSTEYRIRHKDGRYIQVWDQAIVVRRDDEGKPLRMIGSTTDITPRKQIEEALQESEERFRQMAETIEVVFWLSDAFEEKILYVSPAYERIWGRPREELYANFNALVESIHPEDRERVQAAATRIRLQEEGLDVEYRIVRPDGSLRWVRDRSYLIRGADGQPYRLAGFAEDITERRQAEQDLHQSSAILNTISEATPTLIFVKDLQGRMVMGNSALFRTLGQTEAEVIGRTDAEFYINPEEAVEIVATDRQIMETGQMQMVEETLELPHGKRTFLSAKSPYRDGEGDIIGLIGVSVDITERKETQVALRESEERLRVALEAANLGMWYWDLTDNSLTWTEQCKALLGLSADTQPSYEKFMEVLHPDDRQQVFEAVTQCVTRHEGYDVEFRILRPDGIMRWIVAKGNCFYNSTQPTRMMGIVFDITQRKRTEEELQRRTQELTALNTDLAQATAVLEERNQELDQFVYTVSHDLKAPLRAIANLSQWIEDDLEGQLPSENQQQMQLLRERVNRMENLIDGLLNYSRINRSETAKETVDTAQLLAEIIDSLAPPKSFTIEITSELPTLETQRLPLSQVFANLISNAIKHHGRADGRVKIFADEVGKFYQFTVADDGRGIPAEHHERIFAIFQTIGSDESKTNTGVGLAIVKKLVEKHGGTIALKSEIGQGTSFRFTWPKN